MSRKNDFLREVLFSEESNGFRVAGNSMYPLIAPNDRVDVLPLYGEYCAPTPGDCGIFLRNGIFVVHRIVLFSGESVYAAGDNNFFGEWWDTDELVGITRPSEHPLLRMYIVCINWLFFPLRNALPRRARLYLLRFMTKFKEHL